MNVHIISICRCCINYVESITGVDIYGLIGLLMCFIVFTAVILWAWKADKKLMTKMSNIPLEN